MQAKDWGRGKVTHGQHCGSTGKTGWDQETNIAPVQQHLFWPVGWGSDSGLLLFCGHSIFYTQRLCNHQHLQVVGGGEPGILMGGNKEARRIAVVGCQEKCRKLGRFSRTDPPVNRREGDFAGKAFSEDGLCWVVGADEEKIFWRASTALQQGWW